MIRNRKVLRILAVFLMVEMLVSAIAPTFSWALTSGPTAPETTSFEPVDTTDMVNLVTGDFVYNLPLLEVPGPAGGYPLSLSYHAGIKLEQDASWVGLGWTLNPGAINRSVNGYADDYQNIAGTDRSFWEGGEASSFTIGVNVGYGGLASVSAGLVFSEDTYKGSGTGHYYNIGLQERAAQLGGIAGLSASFQTQGGVSPYGDRFSSTGLSMGIGAASKMGLTTSVSAGVSFDRDGKATGNFRAGVNNLGASIASDGSSTFSVGGFSGSVHNSKSGRVSTSGYNYSADVPTPFGFSVRLGKSYQRYWIDETVNVSTNGALYFPSTLPSTSELDNKAYDVYDLQYPYYADATPPDETVAGAFIDYDSYSVLGQGIAGGIKPFHYKSYLLRQNKKDITYRMKSYPLGTNPKAAFRFIGDFSNRYEHAINSNNFVSNSTNPLSFVFDANRTTGENGSDGYDESLNILPGSKHVEWFTNIQINDNEREDEFGQPVPPGPNAAIHKGFVNCTAKGFERLDDYQIGGFKVTNESGVTYHYALPVYSYSEHQYTGRVDEQGKHQFNLFKKAQRYAYTWLLTAVTGPDFVDTNLNGYADNADWGYWVNFEYGMWSGAYSWRNPSSGFNKDIDHNFNTFSKGKKQIYYLNAIRTKTHTALFIKELRADGKGVVHELDEAIRDTPNKEVTDIDNGSYQEIQKISSGTPYTEYPVSTLRLHSIYLMQNKDIVNHEPISDLAGLGNIYYHSQNLSSDLGRFIHGDFVIDIHDIANDPIKTDLKSKCLKKIEFNTDYSLATATPNSYWSELDVLNTSQSTSAALGKLTLRSLAIYGRGEANMIPEIKFNYDEKQAFHGSINEQQTPEELFHRVRLIENVAGFNFRKGEIIHCDLGIRAAYGYVYQVYESSNEIDIKFFQGAQYLFDANGGITFNRTKNPPYLEEFYDLWGMYKVDFNPGTTSTTMQTENVRRMTTSTSAQSVDVWSLREIQTAVGASIKVEYESDVYKSALKSLSNIPIKGIESVPGGKTKIILFEDAAEYGLTSGDLINVRLITAKRYDVIDPDYFSGRRFHCNGVSNTFVYQWYVDNDWGSQYKIAMEAVNGNSFIIDHDFTNRYPAGNICISEQPPYEEGDVPGADCISLQYLTASPPIFLGGEIVSDKIFSPFGGDLRVKKLRLGQWEEERVTSYEYFNGVTSYEPLGLAVPVARLNASLNSCVNSLQQTAFDQYRGYSFDNIYQKFKALFSNSRELPGPGVLYEWVRLKEHIERPDGLTELDGKVEYQFEVFSPKTLDLSIPGGIFTTNPLYPKIGSSTSYAQSSFLNNFNNEVLGLPVTKVQSSQSNKAVIRDFTAIMGSLKKIVLYDKFNNKISETINHYLHDNFSENTYLTNLANFKNQGSIAETFADARVILNPKANPTDADTYTLYGVLSQKVRYPSIQTSQTTINYKSGITNNSENLGFDFYSGQPVKTQVKDAYGNLFVTENTPAYRQYDEMGFAYQGKKNMLTQGAASVTYELHPDNSRGLVAADAVTWSKEIPIVINPTTVNLSPAIYKVWRTQATYAWKGDDATLIDGLYPYQNFSPFNHAGTNSNQWQKLSEIKWSDLYSNVLEATDINGNYAATRMSSDQVLVLATASNAGYSDFAYSGAEDDLMSGKFGGNVSVAGGQVINDETLSHTGRRSLLLPSNGVGFTFEASKANLKNVCPTYHAAVWVKESSPGVPPSVSLIAETNAGVVLSSASPVQKYKAGSWYLIGLDFDLPTSTDQVKVYVKNLSSQGVYVDDFRVQPHNSSVLAYVYNKWGELSHILDDNNLYTEYRYDQMGRLTETWKESFQNGNSMTGKVIYHYAGQ